MFKMSVGMNADDGFELLFENTFLELSRAAADRESDSLGFVDELSEDIQPIAVEPLE